MKILIVGDFHSQIYEEALYNAFLELSFEVGKFSWWQHFKGYQYDLEQEKNTIKKNMASDSRLAAFFIYKIINSFKQ